MREAGKIAMSHFGRVRVERKQDNSVVTEADREIERFLVRELAERYPDIPVFGEEYGVSNEKPSNAIWMIDPIDGTGGFVNELPSWTICLGLVVDGEPLLGLVFAPVTGDLYTADAESGSRLNGTPIRVDPNCACNEGTALVSAYVFLHRNVDVEWPGQVWTLGSAAASMVHVARGGVNAGLINPVSSYDIAASAAILKQAGGDLRYVTSGNPVDFRAFLTEGLCEDWILAANPALCDTARSYFHFRA